MANNGEGVTGEEKLDTWTLAIRSLSQKKDVTIPADCSVGKLREEVSKVFSVESENVCLIYSGKILPDEASLSTHGITASSVVHLVIRPKKVEQSNVPSSEPATNTEETTNNNRGPRSFIASDLADLASMNFGNANFSDIQGRVIDGLRDNPEEMQNVLNSPAIQVLLNNPEIFRNLVMANPQMQQIVEQNPEVSHLLNNPEMLRQMMELMRNPNTMQEMMRTHDRAMINLESLPGGYNALQRIYRDVQEPMMNAAQGSFAFDPSTTGSSAETTSANNQAGTENTEPLPNPWARTGNNRPVDAGSSAGARNSISDAAQQSNPFAMGSNYMESLLDQYCSDPEILRQTLFTNPLVQGNPEFQEQLSQMIPEFIQQWQDPEMRALYGNRDAMQALSQIQEGIAKLQNAAPEIARRLFSLNPTMLFPTATNPGTTTSEMTTGMIEQPATNVTSNVTQPGNNTRSPENYANALMSVINSLAGNQQRQQPADNRPAEDRYASELDQMQVMGFRDRQANIRALVASGGDINIAVEYILEHRDS